MKIRIVLADTDEKYINHFIRAFKIYYFNEVDIVTFSDSTALKKYISSRAYDILLSVASLLPKEAEGKSMILTSEMGIKEMNGRPAICKYQKIENLYKGILDAIAEQKSGITYSYETSGDCFYFSGRRGRKNYGSLSLHQATCQKGISGDVFVT